MNDETKSAYGRPVTQCQGAIGTQGIGSKMFIMAEIETGATVVGKADEDDCVQRSESLATASPTQTTGASSDGDHSGSGDASHTVCHVSPGGVCLAETKIV